MRSIRAQHHVVGAVEALPLISIHDGCVALSIGRETNDSAQDAGAIQQPVLPVVGVAVGISEGDDLLLLAGGGIYLEYLIERLVAHPQIAGWIPDWPFGEAEASSHSSQFCVVVE